MGNLSPQQQLETDAFIKSIFIKNAIVTKDDVTIAKGSWKLIIHNMAPGYLELKDNPEFPSTSCLSFFFDSDQRSREIYNKNMHIQGRAMISMMNSVLNMFEDRKTIHGKLINLAQSHHKKGVSTSQYGSLVRGVLSALQKCLGSSFRGALSEAWYKIFSYILEIVVQKSLEIEKWNSYIQTAGIMVTYVSNTLIHPMKDKIIITEENPMDVTMSRNRVADNYDNLYDIKEEDIDDEKDNNDCPPKNSKCKYLLPKGNSASINNDRYNNKSESNRSRGDSKISRNDDNDSNTASVSACPFSRPQALSFRQNHRNMSSSNTANNEDNECATRSRNTSNTNENSVFFFSSFAHRPLKQSGGTSINDIELTNVAKGNSISRIFNHISHSTRIVSK